MILRDGILYSAPPVCFLFSSPYFFYTMMGFYHEQNQIKSSSELINQNFLGEKGRYHCKTTAGLKATPQPPLDQAVNCKQKNVCSGKSTLFDSLSLAMYISSNILNQCFMLIRCLPSLVFLGHASCQTIERQIFPLLNCNYCESGPADTGITSLP